MCSPCLRVFSSWFCEAVPHKNLYIRAGLCVVQHLQTGQLKLQSDTEKEREIILQQVGL